MKNIKKKLHMQQQLYKRVISFCLSKGANFREYSFCTINN